MKIEKYLKLIVLLGFTVCIDLVQGQSITGVVKDSVSGNEIAYANIVLKNGKGTYSDKSGRFTLNFKNLQSDTLKITSIGYKPKLLPISKFNLKESKDLYLQPKTENLEEVIISHKKVKYTDKVRLGEEKEENIGVTSLIGYETAIFIKNPRERSGKVKRVYINLKKRRNAELIATFNIKFYELDSSVNQPGDLLYEKNLYVQPKNKKYRLWIDVEDLNIKFPEKGICIGVEFVNTYGEVKKYTYFGPMFRYTMSENADYKIWSNYHNLGWSEAPVEHKKFRRRKTGISHPMIGIEVLFPQK